MMKDLSIKLKINGAYFPWDVHPVFGDDIKISFNREENQIFRREKIEGTFKFLNEDFDLIYESAISTRFTLEVYREDEFVGSADFIRTNCEFNLDDKICSVKLTTKDVYEKMLSGYENKHNLVKLAPRRERAILTKRAVLQFYVKGEDVVTNVVGGVHYEQPCKEVNNENELLYTYHFGGYLPLSYIRIDRAVAGSTQSDFLGKYYMDVSTADSSEIIYVHKTNPKWRIQLAHSVSGGWSLTLINTTTQDRPAHADVQAEQSGTQTITFKRTDSDGAVDYAYGTFDSDGALFCRILLPKQVGGSYKRSMDDDITDYDNNYPYVLGLSLSQFAPKIKMVEEKSITPTEWGIGSDEKYFVYPTLSADQQKNGVSPIPVGHSHWERMSSWFLSDDSVDTFVDGFDTPFVLKDSYPIWSAIAVLLKEIDDTISFEGTQEYSMFLYLTGPNPTIESYDFPSCRNALHITPISNVKKTFYQQAAQRGDISLKQILDMLRNVYNCYWFIDSAHRLRIEHISYFKNGDAYTFERPVPSIDVTGKKNLPTGENWGFAQNKVEYETNKCPARYEFKWGDDCTYPFLGEPIDVKDVYLDASRKESVGIDNFLADIDYIITNPGEVSDDLFALYEVNKAGSFVDTFSVRLSDTSPKYTIQNPYLSMLVAEKYYYPFDLSGWKASAGKYELDVYRTKRIKKQMLSCPLTLAEMRSIGVIRTDVGDGVIDKLEAEINTLYAKNTIYYEEPRSVIDKVYYHHPTSQPAPAQFFNPTTSKLRLKVGLAEGGRIQGFRYLDVPLRGSAYLDTITASQNPVLMDAEDISAFTINRKFRQIRGAMLLDDGKSKDGKYVLEISALKSIGVKDYAGIHITANRSIKITLQASNVSSSDYGYTSTMEPAILNTDYADLVVKGTNVNSITIGAGESRYIGYTKSGSISGSEDKVTITIEEL